MRPFLVWGSIIVLVLFAVALAGGWWIAPPPEPFGDPPLAGNRHDVILP